MTSNRRLALILLSCSLAPDVLSQPTLTLSSASSPAGSLVPLNLSISGVTSSNGPSAIQFTLRYASAEFSFIGVSPGTAATTSGKLISCHPLPGQLRCIVWGINAKPISSGAVALVSAIPSLTSLSAVRTIGVSDVMASNATGSLVGPIPANGGGIQILSGSPVLSSLSCSVSTLGPDSSASCAIAMSRAVSSRTTIAVSVSRALLTVPASVVINPGQRLATFAVRAGPLTTNNAVVVTAALNGVYRNAPILLVSVTLKALTCSFAELASNASTTCTVTLTQAPSSPTVVALKDSSILLDLPSSITINAGQSSASFIARAGLVGGGNSVVVIAAFLNGVTRSTLISLQPSVSLNSLTCSPLSLASGGVSTCTTVLTGPAPSPTTLTLSDNSALLMTPASITLNAAQKSGTFTVRAGTLSANGTGLVTATLKGVSKTVSFNLTKSDCPCSLFSPTAVPRTMTDEDTSAVELGVKFRSKVAGYVVGIRFYKGPANTGTHVGHLWTKSGNLLATVTFTNETVVGWQQANFRTPVPIAAGTTYIVSYRAPEGHYSADDGYFATPAERGPLSALQDGPDEANGVYRYGGTAFPTSTYKSSNYWVDVVFDTVPTTSRVGDTFSMVSQLAFVDSDDESGRPVLAGRLMRAGEDAPASSLPEVHVPEMELAKPGQPVSFVVTAKDSTGSPLQITARQLSTGASFDPLSSRLRWTPTPDQVGDHTLAFHATNSAGQTGRGLTTISVGWGQPVLANQAPPSCSPGALATLKGKWLAETEMFAEGGESQELGGTIVRVNGVPASMLHASPTQVTFRCPVIGVGTTLSVSVETMQGATASLKIAVLEALLGPIRYPLLPPLTGN